MSLFVRNSKQTIKSATSATTYVLTKDDNIYIAYPGQTVTLPDPALSFGQTYFIKLGANYTGTSDNVTINVANGGNIEGNSTLILNTSWGYHRFIAGKNNAGSATWMIIV